MKPLLQSYRIFTLWLMIVPACMNGQAPVDKFEDVQKSFVRYQSQVLQEKIFLHVDKSFYLAGEIVWFKAYNVDEYRHKPLGISTVCYMELLNAANRPVLQTKIALKDGMGDGSVVLPASLASGSYVIRAYTAWMKNFDPAFYFAQPLTVVNALKASLPAAEDKRLRYQAGFYPEGGNLVYGIASKVAFKIADAYGSGVSGTVSVADQDNNPVAVARPLSLGMGSFELTPAAGKRYRATISLSDTVMVQDLPVPYAEGFSLRLTEAGDSLLNIAISATGSVAGSTAYLLVHTRQVLTSGQVIQLNNGKASVQIDKKLLADGISVFTLFNTGRQPVCERLYCKTPDKNLVIQAESGQSFQLRSRVPVMLTTRYGTAPVQTNLSMSVFLLDSLQPAGYEDILSYLLLRSDLTGYIESPQLYFNKADPRAPAALDNLMLTQGWRRFRWEDALQDKVPAFRFIPEMEGPVVNGTVTDRRSGSAIPGLSASLSVPGQEFSFGTAVSRQDGSIRFNPGNFYAGREVVAGAINPADSTARIDLENPFSERYGQYPAGKFQLPESWKEQLLMRSIQVQAENSYLIDKKQHSFLREQADTTMFYGKPDYHYHLDDYTRFITMVEVMKEFVMPVRVRKQGDKFRFRVYNSTPQTYFDEDPLILLDGLPVRDADKIMALDPLKVRDIDVLSHNYHIGAFSTPGVISYRTIAGDQAGYQLEPTEIVIEYEGLQHQRAFYAPVYQTGEQLNTRIPDLRNQLCWAPRLQTDNNGKNETSFYSSDVPGTYLIVVQGITAGGLAGSTSIKITVSK